MGLGWFDALAPVAAGISTGINQGKMLGEQQRRQQEEEALRNQILQAQLAKLQKPEPAAEWYPTTEEEAREHELAIHPERWDVEAPNAPVLSEWEKAGFPDQASYLKYLGQKSRAEYPDRFRAPTPKAPPAGITRSNENDEAEGLAVLGQYVGAGVPATMRPQSDAFSAAYKAIRKNNPELSPGRVAKQAMEGVRRARPDLFRKPTDSYSSSYEDLVGGGDALGPEDPEDDPGAVTSEAELAAPRVDTTPATAPTSPAAPAAPAKRVITQDQADYLRQIGRWDPSQYEVR